MTLLSTAEARAQCSPQELTKLIASDAAASDQFGYAVSVSGPTALIGAPLDDNAAGVDAGAAYIFTGSGAVWTEQAKLTASDAAASDQFGFAVAISGDTAVIGAKFADLAVGGDQGAAYVFVRTGDNWGQQAKLTAVDHGANDFFGSAVAIDGDTIVVGSLSDDTPVGNAGSAYVFVRSGTVWAQQAKLTASDAAINDRFGIAVAVQADTAVIGAEGNNHTGIDDTGAAYVFVRSGASWSQEGKLTLLNAAANDFLGVSVAVDGNTALVGANRDDLVVGAEAGSAGVFTRSAGVWTYAAGITATDAAGGDFFGDSVALSGSAALIGSAFTDNTLSGSERGSAYVFFGAGSSWSEQEKLITSDAADSDVFGRSVALDGETAIIGARQDDHAAGINAGSAYVFVLNCNVDGDLDGDGDLDAADADIFIAVLLGLDTDPDHVLRADINGSGQPNGLDVEPFVQAQTGV